MVLLVMSNTHPYSVITFNLKGSSSCLCLI